MFHSLETIFWRYYDGLIRIYSISILVHIIINTVTLDYTISLGVKMAIYGIEQSTDMRDKRTIIKTFSSESTALKWKEYSGHLTHGENAEVQKNYHHTFRCVYVLVGRLPTPKSIEKIRSEWRHSIYAKSVNDVKADYISSNGTEF